MKATSDNVRSYFVQIGRIPMLTPEEEIVLGRKIQKLRSLVSIKDELRRELHREPTRVEWAERANCSMPILERDITHGEKAKSQLVEANLRLVVSIAKKYQQRGVELLDLIQEGNAGLIVAAGKFEPKKGCKFSTLAYWWIRQAIIRFIQFHSRTIRLPAHAHEILNKIKKATQKLSLEKGKTPKLTEIAEYLGEEPEVIRFYLEASRLPTSIDRIVGEDEYSTLGQFLEDKSPRPLELLLENEEPERMAELFQDLTHQERKVLVLRYGLNAEPQTYNKIGSQFGLSRERIRRQEKEAIAKLRSSFAGRNASNS